MEKQLNEIEDRIEIVENKVKGNENKNSSVNNPVLLAETVELRMNKIERELESFRKTFG
jgi:hypothetical protein